MQQSLQNKRGAALLVVVILSAGIAICLTGFISLSLNSMKVADRGFYANSAMNMAESGLEEAVSCFNAAVPATAWSGWNLSGSSATRTLTGFNPGLGTTGTVRVYCNPYNPVGSVQPEVIAEATIALPQGPPIKKMIRVELRPRSLFGTPVAARESITIATNSTFDSWNSDPDGTPLTPSLPYNVSLRNDEMFIGCASGAVGALDLGGTIIDVYGAVSSGGSPAVTGTNTVIQNAESPASPKVDPNLVSTDFIVDFPTVTLPTPSVANAITSTVNTTVSFPAPGDLANPADGRYYYQFASGTKIRLTSNNVLSVTDDVTFIFDHHDGADSIQMTSNNEIVIAADASVRVYTNGDITMNSNTAMNPTGFPAQCLIFGTNATAGGQAILMNSNNVNNVGIYAPNANFRADSNVILNGSLLANQIDIAAYGAIHYDEALRNIPLDMTYGVAEWEELRSAVRRATYAAVMSF